MWDLPGPGLEPVSPALAGGFLTTVPPGKPPVWFYSQFTIKIFFSLFLLIPEADTNVWLLSHLPTWC